MSYLHPFFATSLQRPLSTVPKLGVEEGFLCTYLSFFFQSEKDVASWLRSGVVGQPSYDATTKEIIAQKKKTSDVTSQVNAEKITKKSVKENVAFGE